MAISPLFPYEKPHFHKNNGMPATGWTLNTYIAGTSTPVQLWKDPLGSDLYPVSIKLNSRGEVPGMGLYGDPEKKYKLEFRDENGREVYSVDYIAVTNDPGASNIQTLTSSDGSIAIIPKGDHTVDLRLASGLKMLGAKWGSREGGELGTPDRTWNFSGPIPKGLFQFSTDVTYIEKNATPDLDDEAELQLIVEYIDGEDENISLGKVDIDRSYEGFSQHFHRECLVDIRKTASLRVKLSKNTGIFIVNSAFLMSTGYAHEYESGRGISISDNDVISIRDDYFPKLNPDSTVNYNPVTGDISMNMDVVATKESLDTAVSDLNESISGVKDELSEKADKSELPKIEVDAATGKITTINGNELSVDLSDYDTKEEVDGKLEPVLKELSKKISASDTTYSFFEGPNHTISEEDLSKINSAVMQHHDVVMMTTVASSSGTSYAPYVLTCADGNILYFAGFEIFSTGNINVRTYARKDGNRYAELSNSYIYRLGDITKKQDKLSDGQLANIAAVPGKADKTELPTITIVGDKVTEINGKPLSVDLSDYATTSEVNQKIADISKISYKAASVETSMGSNGSLPTIKAIAGSEGYCSVAMDTANGIKATAHSASVTIGMGTVGVSAVSPAGVWTAAGTSTTLGDIISAPGKISTLQTEVAGKADASELPEITVDPDTDKVTKINGHAVGGGLVYDGVYPIIVDNNSDTGTIRADVIEVDLDKFALKEDVDKKQDIINIEYVESEE